MKTNDCHECDSEKKTVRAKFVKVLLAAEELADLSRLNGLHVALYGWQQQDSTEQFVAHTHYRVVKHVDEFSVVLCVVSCRV